MILPSELKHYLKAHSPVSFAQLKSQFSDTDEVVLKEMLASFIAKDWLKLVTKPPHCGTSCNSCAFSTISWYEVV